ncbi:hypothetical protein NOF55_21130 [Rhizobiaceae bacterium BDR2-2]|uniref:Uncharacterized protein n=1 Tax=Ectorhizobium quercum TaxID=2965071 RepID=A0AAE3N2H8_9HYPH|nr:hypothetical protein [Ectorhizobium quercum]MCX8999613.1 hypothetical protein [Ectorhizobium quercum]
MSSKPLNHVIPVPEHTEEMGPLTEGLLPIVIALLVLVGWIAAFFVFGYPGLIVPALTLVVLLGGLIIWVSRG